MIDCKKAIESGICKADCCGIVTFKKSMVRKNIDKLQASIDEWKVVGNDVALLTKDIKCVFLTKNNNCAVYEDRPDVCRCFGSGKDWDGKEDVLMLCPHFKPNGNTWSPAKKKQIQRIVDKRIDYAMAKAEKTYGKDKEK